MTINDELKMYDDALKNYLWVKVFDDNVFAIIKSYRILICLRLKWGQKRLGQV